MSCLCYYNVMEKPQNKPQEMITEVPKTDQQVVTDKGPQYDFDYDYDPNNGLTHPAEPTGSMLNGPRKTGEVPLPNGNVAVHEITSDGMKQTRIVGSGSVRGPRSAAEAHVAAGVAQPYETEAVLGKNQEGKTQKFGRTIISRLLHREK